MIYTFAEMAHFHGTYNKYMIGHTMDCFQSTFGAVNFRLTSLSEL